MTQTYMAFLPTADPARAFSLDDAPDEADEGYELKFQTGEVHRFYTTEIEVLRYMCNQAIARHNAKIDATPEGEFEALGFPPGTELKFPVCTCVRRPRAEI